MELVSDAPDACRRALGVELERVARSSLASTTAWAAREFLGSTDAATPEGRASCWRGADAFALDRAWPGLVVIADHAAGSQFVRLHERLGVGDALPDALACVALAGARFRGQRGRSWATLAGNLHVSVHFEVDRPAADDQAAIAVMPAVAASQAIERASDGAVRPGLKWVNDLLLGDRKMGGVLSATNVEAGRVRHLLFGIGINVAAAPTLPPSTRSLPPTRLADADASFATPDAWGRLLVPLLDALRACRELLADGRGSDLIDAYRERAAFLGRDVTIWPVDADDETRVEPIARGRVEALLPDLSLRLAGRSEPIRHGRMTFDQDVGPMDRGQRAQ